MRTQIDYEKSIKRHRLTFKMTTELFMTRLLDNSLWLIFLITAGLLFSNKNNYSNNNGVRFLVVFILITLWLLIGLLLLNKLVVVKGTNPLENRKLIIQIMNNKFPKLKLDDAGQKIIRYDLKTGLLTWGKRITVIFQNENIYLNITTTGRYDIKSPFHSVFHYFTLKSIGKQFKDRNKSR
jgi:hypothetical protein